LSKDVAAELDAGYESYAAKRAKAQERWTRKMLYKTQLKKRSGKNQKGGGCEE